jgi:hypothetical protein
VLPELPPEVLPLPEPLEPPDVLPLVPPEPLPLLLPDVLPLVLPEVLPLLLPELWPPLLLPEPLLVVPPSPELLVVLLEQPLTYAATGTARHAMSPNPRLNFTANLPWQRRCAVQYSALPYSQDRPGSSRAHCASTQSPLAVRHINVRCESPRRRALSS